MGIERTRSAAAGRQGRRAAISLVWLAGLAGCSTFDRDFRSALGAHPDPEPLLGAWEGGWRSEVTGHTGGLRALITRAEKGGFRTRYRATYGCCFSFEYTVEMTVEPRGEALGFRGSADLGWLAGGVYSYEGQVKGAEFTSAYRSKSDRGVFEMRRPSPPSPSP
ncbi:MAG: hypothetical protein ACRD2T_01350 [Thermoanaerobaculia bacterium]